MSRSRTPNHSANEKLANIAKSWIAYFNGETSHEALKKDQQAYKDMTDRFENLRKWATDLSVGGRHSENKAIKDEHANVAQQFVTAVAKFFGNAIPRKPRELREALDAIATRSPSPEMPEDMSVSSLSLDLSNAFISTPSRELLSPIDERRMSISSPSVEEEPEMKRPASTRSAVMSRLAREEISASAAHMRSLSEGATAARKPAQQGLSFSPKKAVASPWLLKQSEKAFKSWIAYLNFEEGSVCTSDMIRQFERLCKMANERKAYSQEMRALMKRFENSATEFFRSIYDSLPEKDSRKSILWNDQFHTLSLPRTETDLMNVLDAIPRAAVLVPQFS